MNRLYMDVHVPSAISDGLRSRGVDVLTAQEDGTTELPDSDLLDRATALGRVLFTRDKHFLQEGIRRQREGEAFAGVTYARQLRVSIGTCIDDLELAAIVGQPEDFANQVKHLPLQ